MTPANAFPDGADATMWLPSTPGFAAPAVEAAASCWGGSPASMSGQARVEPAAAELSSLVCTLIRAMVSVPEFGAQVARSETGPCEASVTGAAPSATVV